MGNKEADGRFALMASITQVNVPVGVKSEEEHESSVAFEVDEDSPITVLVLPIVEPKPATYFPLGVDINGKLFALKNVGR